MVRIDLTLEGVVSDVINTIRQLAAGNGSTPTTVSNNPDDDLLVNPPVQPPVDDTGSVTEDPWTDELARALWVLLTPDAREIYRRVAHGDGHILHRDALLDAMNLTARTLSGQLSSQGHALRRIRRRHDVNLPHPMTFDPSSEQYRMQPDLAGVIVELDL